MSEPLHLKYRPQEFNEVVGQDAVVKSLQNVIKKGMSHAFLFHGPSGTGKTTLARLAALAVGCDESSIMEIDAATHTGIESMRAVQDTLNYKPFGKAQNKAVLIDEFHMMSKSAFNSLLKVVEEPPEHVYWFFCTTELGRVPQTIKTRCTTYGLKLVSEKDLKGLLIEVLVAEDADDLDEGVFNVIITEAKGSPRQLLVNAALCLDAKNKKEAQEILHLASEGDEVLELCRFLAKGGSWQKAMAIVGKLENDNAESVRIQVVNYMGAAAMKSKNPKEATFFLNVMEAFSESYNPSERLAPLLQSIGQVLFSE